MIDMYLAVFLLVFVVFLIKSVHRNNSRHFYLTFEQFRQLYCSTSKNSIENRSILSSVDMFHRCDEINPIHQTSNDDYLFIVEYIEDFLCQINENVKRPGPVCPFIPRSLKQKSIHFYVHDDRQITSEFDLIKIVRQCRYDFLHRLEPIGKSRDKLVFKCLLIVVQSSNISHSTIERIQTVLKPEFILQYGLMIGQFYQSLNATSKRNEDFFPLRTKCPLLVIRYLVADDIDFLNQKEKYSVEIRRKFLRKYLNLYHSGQLYRSKVGHLQMANQILAELIRSED